MRRPGATGGAGTALRTGLAQRTQLAPAVQQALSVLRLPAADLQAEIAREAALNPYLRWRGSAIPAGEGAADALAAEPSRLQALADQIGLMRLDPAVRAMATHLAAELREDGYLDTPLEEVAADLGVPIEIAEAGLAALQRCEPAGVGARSLSECLALQLVDRGLPADRAAAVVAHLEAFVARDWRALQKALGLDRAALERIGALLPALVAHPFARTAEAPALVADLVAEPDAEGRLTVRRTDAAGLRLTLDPALMATKAATPEAAEARARAQALVAAVRARGETLERIGAHLLEAQAEFLAHGPDRLRPLTRRSVAEALGLHPSTVGRAVAGKAIDLAGRLVPLSRFLAAPLPQGDGTALAGFAVRDRIARLIAAEPPGAPLSDEALRQALAAEGIDIARRTVAKYREWMKLPSSHGRRRMARVRAEAGAARARQSG
ncbi:MAG: RNA polymerase factor sigma-54 [Alkalilacustris sp.]